MTLRSQPRHLVGNANRPSRRAGFALLITVTLLAFLALLLVGLATYTRVESAVAGNAQRQTQARQNALVALNVALGQLQNYGGADTRATASADAFPNRAGGTHYTGVWNSAGTGTTPLTWLVSGNELQAGGQPLPLAVTPLTNLTATNSATLVSTNTSGTLDDVRAPLVPITTVGVPGQSTTTPSTIGRYAWWVGDQGVKAPVAVADRSASVGYPPWTESGATDLRDRIRQQISLGAVAADSAAAPIFDARDTAGTQTNATLAGNTIVANQLAFYRRSAGGTVGLATLRQNFWVWSANNLSVLASTSPLSAGLRRDLSIDPSPLGSDVQAWLDYTTYMEKPADSATSAFPPSPAIGTASLRRRYIMRSGPPAVVPVPSFFLLTFNIRTLNQSTAVSPLEVRARWLCTLWNPTTSALVPENLRLEVTGLPNIRVDDETAGGGAAAAFSVQSAYGTPLKISLPWNSTPTAGTTGEDRQSWLPGRTYTWCSLPDSTGPSPADPGYGSNFYDRNLNATAGAGVRVAAPTGATIDGSHFCHIDGDSRTLTLNLYAVRATGDVLLGTFTSPQFSAFASDPQVLSDNGYQFSYVFRLAEGTENTAWLQSPASDPHLGSLDASAYVSGPNGPTPSLYQNYTTISAPDRLLDRATNSFTYDEDTPVFEFPRAPVLSLGSLQHVALTGVRPFAIGNSWGVTAQLNGVPAARVFDQFFFSGLASGVTPTGSGTTLLLPNPLLRVNPRKSNGTTTTAADLLAAPNARSSKFLLQGGAFNLNSVSIPAWAAVLRTVRFTAPVSFRYLNALPNTGTSSSDSSFMTLQSPDAQFFRFAQSAQETYLADAGVAAGSGVASAANTHLFRQGVIALNSGRVSQLATSIVALVKARLAANGPFRTLEEFLSPSANYLGSGGEQISLLEKAIADAGINSAVAEFSSQWLTQADIMTALAPVLFPRSDTFVIRTYGEAVNPATTGTEGRAWCEAIVQRVPEYFDPTDPEETGPTALNSTNKAYGRRFKVISFRWLTRSDI